MWIQTDEEGEELEVWELDPELARNLKTLRNPLPNHPDHAIVLTEAEEALLDFLRSGQVWKSHYDDPENLAEALDPAVGGMTPQSVLAMRRAEWLSMIHLQERVRAFCELTFEEPQG